MSDIKPKIEDDEEELTEDLYGDIGDDDVYGDISALDNSHPGDENDDEREVERGMMAEDTEPQPSSANQASSSQYQPIPTFQSDAGAGPSGGYKPFTAPQTFQGGGGGGGGGGGYGGGGGGGGGGEDRIRPSDMPDEGKMFIGGLNWDTTDETLKSYFSQFGPVSACTIMRDPMGRSRGFAFLTFENAGSVEVVMGREHKVDDKIIDPKRAIPRAEHARSQKIFVGGLANTINNASLKAFFSQFGNVIDAHVMLDRETMRNKGFGFVTFDDEGGVERSMLGTGMVFEGKMIEVKKAQPRQGRDQAPSSVQQPINTYTSSGGASSSGGNYGGGGGGMGGMGGGGNAGGLGMGMGGMGGMGFDANAMALMYQKMMMQNMMNPMMNMNMMGGGQNRMGNMGAGGMGMGGMGMGGMGMGGMGMMGMGGMNGQGGGAINPMMMGNLLPGQPGGGRSPNGSLPGNVPTGPRGGPRAPPTGPSAATGAAAAGGAVAGGQGQPARFSTQGQARARPY